MSLRRRDARAQAILTVRTATFVLPIGMEIGATSFRGLVTIAAAGAELALLAGCSALAARTLRARRVIAVRLVSMVRLAISSAMLF